MHVVRIQELEKQKYENQEFLRIYKHLRCLLLKSAPTYFTDSEQFLV